MKKACAIFDVAHGVNVAGKKSPDGEHEEDLWSRARVRNIIKKMQRFTLNFDITSPYVNEPNEPGLIKRVKHYNEISDLYPTRPLLWSLHNDGLLMGDWQTTANHFKIFTSRGHTRADDYATIIGEMLAVNLPGEDFSWAYWDDEPGKSDLDWEKDFWVIAGKKTRPVIKPKYDGVLVENLFQDHPEGVKKLKDPVWNDKLEDVYVMATFRCMHLIKVQSYIPQLIIKQ